MLIFDLFGDTIISNNQYTQYYTSIDWISAQHLKSASGWSTDNSNTNHSNLSFKPSGDLSYWSSNSYTNYSNSEICKHWTVTYNNGPWNSTKLINTSMRGGSNIIDIMNSGPNELRKVKDA
mgnify:CR=1 FL=1|tara:strand:+ start:532 stop:894 length:363 start_codon:yes stop_codon:yes gene_type:complete